VTKQLIAALLLLTPVGHAATSISGPLSTTHSANPCEDNACGEHGACTPVGSSYICLCDEGYTGALCDELDIDFCAADPCGAHGQCLASSRAYTCDCDEGWDGMACDTCDEGFGGADCEPCPCG